MTTGHGREQDPPRPLLDYRILVRVEAYWVAPCDPPPRALVEARRSRSLTPFPCIPVVVKASEALNRTGCPWVGTLQGGKSTQ